MTKISKQVDAERCKKEFFVNYRTKMGSKNIFCDNYLVGVVRDARKYEDQVEIAVANIKDSDTMRHKSKAAFFINSILPSSYSSSPMYFSGECRNMFNFFEISYFNVLRSNCFQLIIPHVFHIEFAIKI